MSQPTEDDVPARKTLKQIKAEKDALYDAGDRASRDVQMRANGLRNLWESKGYNRVSVTKALGLSSREAWVYEFVLDAGTPEHKAALAHVQALPTVAKSAAMSVTTSTKSNGLTAARKAKNYGYESLVAALPALGMVAKDIVALEATGTAAQVAPVLKALAALPVRPHNFWAILEGRVEAPTAKPTAKPPKAAPKAKDERPNVEQELKRLKDFQRTTVERVHQRLWLDADPAKRFLVADEVGLGKTMVARGVIAKTIDHLWDVEDRIDIVYICSNGAIARQNLARLALDGYDMDEGSHADRLTMLPEALKGLKRNKVNFISFTPGTSFNVSESGGRQGERVLLQRMLAKALGRRVLTQRGWIQLFRGGVAFGNYEARLMQYDDRSFDKDLAIKFGEDVRTAITYKERPLLDELEETAVALRRVVGNPTHELSRHRYRLIGQLRSLIATAAVEALEPDLVILDEFQRFKDLLTPGTPGAQLAHAIFQQKTARVLMLSATPYKMYTLPDEPEGDDHYKDFRDTITFLAGAEQAEAVISGLATMRGGLLSDDPTAKERARGARDEVEVRLRSVMSRTERGRSSQDRDGMLGERPFGFELTPTDLLAYSSAQRVVSCLPGARDIFEFWRSSPYVLNIMERYQVKQKLDDALTKPTTELLAALGQASGLLDWQQIEKYGELDPGNAKMRGLVKDVLDRGAWRLLWLPPSLPYYESAGAFADPELAGFTKRLVFSAWAVVPKAISLVLSYEAERRAVTEAGGRAAERAYSAERATGLLRFQTAVARTSSGGTRETGMPALALLYPSTTLARLGDPLALARKSAALPLGREELLTQVQTRLETALTAFPAATGDVDERWYWAAPFLLDEAEMGDVQEGFLDVMTNWGDDDEGETESQLARHVQVARSITAEELGGRPADLIPVLARLAIAGPGVTSLRALSRVCGGDVSLDDEEMRDTACLISWALRSLFNRPEAMAAVRGAETGERYWQAVLAYCLDGNLQAVLDEYVHVLIDAEGLQDKTFEERAERLAEVLGEVLSLRTVTASIDEIQVDQSRASIERHRIRTHFAVRFGRGQDEDNQMQRESAVRDAYNSPFWPFVLASTSVGQEGLDFHPYSHAIVHWNLPGNPVDLEQREGRVHRFKGHAIRRNVALTHGSAALGDADDPWTDVFAAAKADSGGANDLTPYWVYAPDGGFRIERYVPAAPLSREAARYRRLLRTMGAYRLVMGQPRQEDLLRYVGENVQALDWLQIDLTPQ